MKLKLLILLTLLFNYSYGQFMMTGSVEKADIETEPGLLWKFQTNGPIVGSPVIDNGTVFIGSLDSTLYALDFSTGNLKWKITTGGAIRSSVCLAPQRLFLLSSDGFLYRLKKDSGSVDGVFQTMNGFLGDQQNDIFDYFTSTPIIVDSTIYFGSGDDIYAVSIKDGNIKWTYKAADAVHTKLAISNNQLFAGSFDGHLYALDVNTGKLLWKFKTIGKYSFPKGEVTGNPVVASGMVFVGARDCNLYAIDVRGGFGNWMRQFSLGWALPVTLNDSVIYVGTSDDRTLYALDIRSGGEVWKTNAGFNVFGGCAIGGKIGYFCTLAGKVHGIDLKTGKIIWTIETEGYKANHLAWLKPDDSYRDDIGKLIKTPIDMLRMYKQLGGIFGTPAQNGDRIVVAGYDGMVNCYAVDAKK
jgi:eukaryotic-like serine/threonine-protein kinase